jgi:hypothetical protein
MFESTVLESPVKKYILTREETGKILSRVYDDHNSVKDFFTEKAETAIQNWRYYEPNKQFSDAEKLRVTKDKRIPYEFNEIFQKIDHLVGTQTQTRLDTRILGRERSDEAASELLTFIVKWMEQVNDIEYIETSVFQEGLIGGCGAVVIRWQLSDVDRGYCEIESVPPNELYWDNMYKRMDMKDARWMMRVQDMTRIDAIEIFHEYEEQIKDAIQYMPGAGGRIQNTYNEFQDSARRSGYRLTDESRELLTVVEYYEKVKVYKYTVADDIAGDVRKFDGYGEAKAYYDGLVDGYTKNGEALIHVNGTPRCVLATNMVDNVVQTIVIGDQVIMHEPTILPFFPYEVFFAYFDKGDYWSFVEYMIYPQMLINRFFSQWDYILGTSPKALMTVIPNLLSQGWTTDKVSDEAGKTAPVIPVKAHAALKMHENQQVNPGYFQGIDFGRNFMQEATGGKNALGLTESAAESGRAVIARAEQGGIARLPLFDKLRYWRKNLTLKMVWYIKNFMTAGQVLRIIGADEDVQYVEINNDLLDTLQEIELDVIVDEAVKSASVKQAQFQDFQKWLAVTPGIPTEISSSIMLELSSIPQSKKRDIMQQLEFHKEYTMKKAEAERLQKLTQEVKDSLLKTEIKSELQRTDELKDIQDQAGKAEKEVRTQLGKLQEAEMEYRDNNLLPSEKLALQDKMRSPEDIQGANAAGIMGSMQR